MKITFVNTNHNTKVSFLTDGFIDSTKANKLRHKLCPNPSRCNLCDGVIMGAFIDNKCFIGKHFTEYADGSIRIGS